ncbi:hypothetical protein [Sphingomonas daechungensis]|uniref:hypothetical protein n=1 Tax=Sphingomonas daechungensis TaxID=1176646 RepID=UPI003785220A
MATFPLVALAFFLMFAVVAQFVDLEQETWVFFVFAVPFLFAAATLNNLVTKRMEKRWIARRQTQMPSQNGTMRR